MQLIRFIAVTRPLKYAQHKNSNRIYLTIAFVWLISIAIASPIVAGFNDTPDRDLFQCEFNNERFLIYSSIFSFYIPTIAMIILYYRIFKVIRTRAKNAALSKNSTIRNKNQLNNNDNNNNNSNTVKTKLLNGSGNEKEKINLLSEGIFKLKNSKTIESNENNLNNITITNNKLNNTATTTTTTTTSDGDKLPKSNVINSTKVGDNANNLNDIVAETNLTNVTNRFNDPNKNVPLLLSNNEKKIVTTTAILSNNKNKSVEVKKNKAITVQRFQSPAMISTNKERKVTKTLAIVLIVFLVCW